MPNSFPLVSDPHKHVAFATLTHGSVANSVRIECHLASLSCQIAFPWALLSPSWRLLVRSTHWRRSRLRSRWGRLVADVPRSLGRLWGPECPGPCFRSSRRPPFLSSCQGGPGPRAASARRTRGTLPAHTQRCADAMREQVDLTSQRALGAL